MKLTRREGLTGAMAMAGLAAVPVLSEKETAAKPIECRCQWCEQKYLAKVIIAYGNYCSRSCWDKAEQAAQEREHLRSISKVIWANAWVAEDGRRILDVMFVDRRQASFDCTGRGWHAMSSRDWAEVEIEADSLTLVWKRGGLKDWGQWLRQNADGVYQIGEKYRTEPIDPITAWDAWATSDEPGAVRLRHWSQTGSDPWADRVPEIGPGSSRFGAWMPCTLELPDGALGELRPVNGVTIGGSS